MSLKYQCLKIDINESYLEFYNSEVRKVFINYGINHYSTPTITTWKSSIVERVNRTLKQRIQRYFTENKTVNWIDIIKNVVKNYNATPHSSHGFAPQDVNAENKDTVYKKMYPGVALRTVCKLKIGDKVRKIIEKDLRYEKGYTQNWSDEIYIITEIRQQGGVCWYYITELDGTKVKGIWYYYQLNLVSRNIRKYAHKSTQQKN